MAQPILTEHNLRLYLMDLPQYNTLIDGTMFTAEMINQAVVVCTDYYNISNPPSNDFISVEQFPSSYLLTVGVSGYLLKSAAINQAINNLTYNADGVEIRDKDKAEIFTTLGTNLWNEYKEMVFNLKTNQNLSQAIGNSYSEFITRLYS